MDSRIERLSSVLTQYSCRLQEGENLLIQYEGNAAVPLVRQLIRETYKLGARPFVQHRDSTVLRELLLGADEEQLKLYSALQLQQMEAMDAFIDIRGGENSAELSDVPLDRQLLYDSMMNPVETCRINHTKWVVLCYPSASMAQMLGTSLEGLGDFYFRVCNMDYGKMSRAMDSLAALMERTDRVRITGPGTDLTFSIKGIPAVKCDGDMNIPDGEVFTAPVRDSVNGVICYNVPSRIKGFTFEKIRFEVKDGRIVKAEANDCERLNTLLDTDWGARCFGEFAIGVNPYILEPMQDILFDEKICGSFHLTPGDAYADTDNGNRSELHWDLIQIQRPEYGGGEIWFDDTLIRKDGRFVLDELDALNPERLRGENG